MSAGMGVDPDLHNTGWAIVDSNGPTLLAFGVCKVPIKLKQEAAAVAMANAMSDIAPQFHYCGLAIVEGQQIYLKGKALPQDLLQIAYVSGAAGFILSQDSMIGETVILKPKDISSVPKAIRQARAFKALGIPYTKHKTKNESWCYPRDLRGLTRTQWKHVADAVFIALFAANGGKKK